MTRPPDCKMTRNYEAERYRRYARELREQAKLAEQSAAKEAILVASRCAPDRCRPGGVSTSERGLAVPAALALRRFASCWTYRRYTDVARCSGPRQYSKRRNLGAGVLKRKCDNSPCWPDWRGFFLQSDDQCATGGGKALRNLSRSASDHAKLCQMRFHDRCSFDQEDSW